MRHLGFLLKVRTTTNLCRAKLSSKNPPSWTSVAENVPKTYETQAKKLARVLEEKFRISEDGTVINSRSGVKSDVTAADLMSFYVTKKKTKLTPSHLKEIVEEMNKIHVLPLHVNSKKVYEEAKKIADASRLLPPESESEAVLPLEKSQQVEKTSVQVQQTSSSPPVTENVHKVHEKKKEGELEYGAENVHKVHEKKKEGELEYGAVSAQDLYDLQLQSAKIVRKKQAKESKQIEQVSAQEFRLATEQAEERLSTPRTDLNSPSAWGNRQEMTEACQAKEKVKAGEKSPEPGLITEQLAQVRPESKIQTEESKVESKSKPESANLTKNPDVVTPTEFSQSSTKTAVPNQTTEIPKAPPEEISKTTFKDDSFDGNGGKPPGNSRDISIYTMVGLAIGLMFYLFKREGATARANSKELSMVIKKEKSEEQDEDTKENYSAPELQVLKESSAALSPRDLETEEISETSPEVLQDPAVNRS